MLLLHVVFIGILIGIGHLVFQHLDEVVEDNGDHGAASRSNPCSSSASCLGNKETSVQLTVDPVFAVEDACHNARSERPRGIEGATGVIHTHELRHE